MQDGLAQPRYWAQQLDGHSPAARCQSPRLAALAGRGLIEVADAYAHAEDLSLVETYLAG